MNREGGPILVKFFSRDKISWNIEMTDRIPNSVWSLCSLRQLNYLRTNLFVYGHPGHTRYRPRDLALG